MHPLKKIGLGLCLVLITADGHAASTSPGKKSAFESLSAIPMPVYPAPLTATIAKGQKKTVLAIAATLRDSGPPGRCLGLQVSVNSVLAESGPASAMPITVTDCGGCGGAAESFCSVTGTWWLDVDAAETANPGMFVGQPLSITLAYGDGTAAGPGPADVMLSVTVQKK